MNTVTRTMTILLVGLLVIGASLGLANLAFSQSGGGLIRQTGSSSSSFIGDNNYGENEFDNEFDDDDDEFGDDDENEGSLGLIGIGGLGLVSLGLIAGGNAKSKSKRFK